jgi:tetratricopeptide (TPR) repeat protein
MFARVSRKGDDLLESERQSEELLVQLVKLNDRQRLHKLYFDLMWVYLARANFDKCIHICDSAALLAQEIGVPPVQYPTIKAIALSRIGSFEESQFSLNEEVADADHPFGQAFKNYGAAHYLLDIMAFDEAAEILDITTVQAKLLGRAWLVRGSQQLKAAALIHSGNLDESKLDEIIENLTAVDSALPKLIVGEIDFAARLFESALDHAKMAAKEADKEGRRSAFIPALELQLRIMLKLDRPQDVVSLADQGIQMALETDYLTMLWRLHDARARALESLGNQAESAEEYRSAAKLINDLADNIIDRKHKKGFLSYPQVASILEKVREIQEEGQGDETKHG